MPDPTVTVRPGTVVDAPAIAALLTELGATGVDAAEAGRRVRERPEEVLLGCVDGEPAGLMAIRTVLYFGHARPLAHISALVVGERWRRDGVARALVDAAQGWAEAHQCAGVELLCALTPARESAHRFYPAMGFVANASHYWRPLDAPDA